MIRPLAEKLATSLRNISEVQFAVVVTPSAQVMDRLWEKVPELLPYHPQYMG